jgi:hypothetical protein
MKRIIGNCLLALGLSALVLLVWMTPVQVRTSDGVIERVPINWSGIAVILMIVAAMVWGGISLRRQGARKAPA